MYTHTHTHTHKQGRFRIQWYAGRRTRRGDRAWRRGRRGDLTGRRAEGVGEVVMGAHGVRAGRRRLLRGEGDHWIVEPEPTTSTVGLSYQSPETGEQPSLSVRQT